MRRLEIDEKYQRTCLAVLSVVLLLDDLFHFQQKALLQYYFVGGIVPQNWHQNTTIFKIGIQSSILLKCMLPRYV